MVWNFPGPVDHFLAVVVPRNEMLDLDPIQEDTAATSVSLAACEEVAAGDIYNEFDLDSALIDNDQ